MNGDSRMKNRIYMLGAISNGQMNSFIITTEEGGVIVIDGGYDTEALNLIEHLKDITGEETPHIDAWFLSHAHHDHICAFMEIIEKYSERVSIEKVYYAFPSIQYFEKFGEIRAKIIRRFYSLLPLFADRICTVSKGDTYSIKGAGFDILYSAFEPDYIDGSGNDSTTVFRMTLGGKTTMFLGDIAEDVGHRLVAEYGDALKSDICQMAHHGQNGAGRDVYEAVHPDICLWCTPEWLWNNDLGEGFNTAQFTTVTTRTWMDELGIKNHLVMKDGDHVVEL